MTPLPAISAALRSSLDFSGRSARAEFWWFVLLAVMVVWGLASVEDALWARGLDWQSDAVGWVCVTFAVLLVLPLVAVTVRRFHDVGFSGWWVLAIWVASFLVQGGLSVRSAIAILPSDNPLTTPTGLRPDPVFIALLVALALIYLIEVVICAWPGNWGPNKYGPPPIHRQREFNAEVFQ